MGVFEEVVQMLEARKRKPQPQIAPAGYPLPTQPQPGMLDLPPPVQQEMMRDPALEQKIREYMLRQRMQQIPMNQTATTGTRG